ncbi:Hsp20/alpha crystallin family protein [Candidatus Binatus sp.]|uniref:Hsp20/alpha crystallin family protein n=2 Tax=Candidatus Binatus sp. TaxID=2811406 RepID=UPI003C6F8B81
MDQQPSWLDVSMRPALPPPPTTADVYEPAGGEAYVVEIHVPGLKPEEIAVEATPDGLRVSTHPSQEENSDRIYLQREQDSRPWSRLFDFPMEIDPDKVRATVEAGILKIYAPKALVSPPRVIRVKD